jgi:hypothetical protein
MGLLITVIFIPLIQTTNQSIKNAPMHKDLFSCRLYLVDNGSCAAALPVVTVWGDVPGALNGIATVADCGDFYVT